LIEGCKKVTLIVDSVVSEINIMNSSGVKIVAHVQLPMVTIESSNEI